MVCLLLQVHFYFWIFIFLFCLYAVTIEFYVLLYLELYTVIKILIVDVIISYQITTES